MQKFSNITSIHQLPYLLLLLLFILLILVQQCIHADPLLQLLIRGLPFLGIRVLLGEVLHVSWLAHDVELEVLVGLGGDGEDEVDSGLFLLRRELLVLCL